MAHQRPTFCARTLAFLAAALLAAVAGTGLSTGGCASKKSAPNGGKVPGDGATGSPAGDRGQVSVTSRDDGEQVELRSGARLVVTLKSNPTTGYSWHVDRVDTKVLRPAGAAVFEPDSKLVGAGGVEILRFRAVASGQTDLELGYRRPWEKGVKPLRSFWVDVIVR